MQGHTQQTHKHASKRDKNKAQISNSSAAHSKPHRGEGSGCGVGVLGYSVTVFARRPSVRPAQLHACVTPAQHTRSQRMSKQTSTIHYHPPSTTIITTIPHHPHTHTYTYTCTCTYTYTYIYIHPPSPPTIYQPPPPPATL